MNATYLLLIVAGLAMTGWGIPASYRLARPWHILAALVALIGVATALLGTLLLVVPGFFAR
jgi:hypothetical protein